MNKNINYIGDFLLLLFKSVKSLYAVIFVDVSNTFVHSCSLSFIRFANFTTQANFLLSSSSSSHYFIKSTREWTCCMCGAWRRKITLQLLHKNKVERNCNIKSWCELQFCEGKRVNKMSLIWKQQMHANINFSILREQIIWLICE
jgi:hypothetical protein